MKTPPNISDALLPKAFSRFNPGTFCTVGLLACWRPICGHLRHAPLANSHGYWLRGASHNMARATRGGKRLVAAKANREVKRSGRSHNCLATRLAIIASPS